MTTKIKPRIEYMIDNEVLSFNGTHTYDNNDYTSFRASVDGEVLVSGMFDSVPDKNDLLGLIEHLEIEHAIICDIELFDTFNQSWEFVA